MRRRLPSDRIYPAGLAGLSSRVVRLRTGVQVRIVETGPAISPAVLCLHGWAANAYSFRHLLPTLASAGFRALAVDLKGHGQSDKPRGAAEYGEDAMRAHVVEILDALELARASIVAHSMGAILALDVAIAQPERVDALALLAPAGLSDVSYLTLLRLGSPALTRPLLPLFVPRWLVRAVLRWASAHGSRPSEEDIDQYWAQSAAPGYAMAARDLVHGYRWTPFSRDVLRRVSTPTLIVLGAEDRMFDAGTTARLAAELPNARVEVLNAVGHLVAEEAPEKVGALVTGFLRQHVTTTTAAAGRVAGKQPGG